MKRVFTSQNLRSGAGGIDGKTLSPAQLAIAGASAGLANSVVSGPVEHIRIRTYHLHGSHESFLTNIYRATNAISQEPHIQGTVRRHEEDCG